MEKHARANHHVNRAQRAPPKPDQVVRPESTVISMCLHPCNHLPTSYNHLPMSVLSSALVRVIICLRPCNHLPTSVLESALCSAFCSEKWHPECPRIATTLIPKSIKSWSKIALKSILKPLGELLELSWQAGGLLGASWSALGSLRGRKKDPWNGSWALQEESQDRFQLSWGPKGSQNRARKGLKWAPKSNPG